MNKWIKCTDELPDDLIDVLVTDGISVEIMWHDCDGYWDSWTHVLDRSICTEDIIYWMPLPKLPGE